MQFNVMKTFVSYQIAFFILEFKLGID